MSVYIKYQIHTLEPVKIGRQGNQAAVESLSYITGSTLRGAVISSYIKSFCDGSFENASKEEYISVLKGTSFFDAYPYVDGKMLLPIPSVYYADKHKIREHRRKVECGKVSTLDIHSCALLGDESIPKEGEQRIDLGKYVDLSDEKSISPYSVAMNGKLHIALATDKERSKMFRYEAIAPNQVFLGVIVCPDDLSDKFEKILKGDGVKSIFYLGGSKGSGYGRCAVSSVERCTYEELYESLHKASADNIFTVYAASNLILLDENGKNTGEISTALLEEKLGVKNIKLEKAFSSTYVAEGFNHTWRARQVQQTAVSAGSVFVYSYEGDLLDDKVYLLEAEGIGQRRAEGYGRIIINSKLNKESRNDYKKEDNISQLDVSKLSAESRDIADKILYDILEKRVSKEIEYKALDIKSSAKNIIKTMSLTQISKLYNLLVSFDGLCDISEEEISKRISLFRDDIKSIAEDKYKKTRIYFARNVSPNMLEVMDQLLDNSFTIKQWNYELGDKLDSISVGNKKANISGQKLKRWYLSKLLYYVMRSEGGK